MKLRTVNQDPFKEKGGYYDAVICASGYESRARNMAERLDAGGYKIRNKYAWAFTEHNNNCARPANDKCFEKLGYALVPCGGNSVFDVHQAFASVLTSIQERKSPRLLVDISCMTRAWYGEIVHMLLMFSAHEELQVDFAYTPSEFVAPPEEYPPNRVAGPVPGFVGMALPDKPTILGIGLGYHRDRAIGLKDYLDPKLTVLFHPNPSFDPRYVKSVSATNEQILSEVSLNNIVAYPVNDLVATFSMLNSLCEGLMRNSRVVLCSIGPKTFGLCCFLVATIQRDISIWRVSADAHETPIDHKPRGTPLVLSTIWNRGDTSKL
jgi:hypothetical protein